MASYDDSLLMMNDQTTWPCEILFMKKLRQSKEAIVPFSQAVSEMKFGHMKRDDGVAPCRIYNDDGSLLEEFSNTFSALDAGWRVD